MEIAAANCVEWAAAGAPLGGQVASGDRHFVGVRPDGVLIGAIDVLGHGVEASRVADLAVEALIQSGGDETMLELMQRCHERLIGTRGAVMSLAMFRPSVGTLTWVGVGNVEGVLLRGGSHGPGHRELLVSRAGVVGDRLPPLSAALVNVTRGDTLVLATDGIAADFEHSVVLADEPRVNADRILARHTRGVDDALTVVARYLGPSSGAA